MKNGKTLIIFDFDMTLFKTREFWREYIFPFYIKIGIPRELIGKAYFKAGWVKSDHLIPRIFIGELYKIIKNNKNYTKKQLKDIFEKRVYSPAVKRYFYPYSIKLLKKAKKKYQMLLISRGDKKFKTKIFGYCGLNKYFSPEEMIVAEGKKIKSIEGLVIPTNCIIVDDVGKDAKVLASFLVKKGASVRILLVDNKKPVESLKEIFKKI